jgi:hypothetical protein
VADQSRSAIWISFIAGVTAFANIHQGLSQVSPRQHALFLDVTYKKRPETSLTSLDKKLDPVHTHGVHDTSLYLCLPREQVDDVIATGWGDAHPHRVSLAEFMVYGPRDDEELDIVLVLNGESLEWARELNS